MQTMAATEAQGPRKGDKPPHQLLHHQSGQATTHMVATDTQSRAVERDGGLLFFAMPPWLQPFDRARQQASCYPSLQHDTHRHTMHAVTSETLVP
jgi:hypothetical protein